MRLLAVLMAAMLVASSAAEARTPREVLYTALPLVDGTGELRALEVVITFKGAESGRTSLALPDHWAEAHDAWRRLQGLEVKGGSLLPGEGPSRVLAHRPGAAIEIRYRIGLTAEPDRDHSKGEPIVRPDWFMLHGETVFAIPGADPTKARFRWGGRPEGWTLASDLEHHDGRVGDLDNIAESVLVGAKTARDLTREVGRGRLRVVIIGRWPFAPDVFADATARVMRAEDAFWHEPGEDYLVTVAPLGPAIGGGASTTGTGKGDGFAVESTTNVDLSRDPHFLAHEYMHSWIPQRLGGFAAQDEARDYWFSEGFTDFYATRALLRSGVWSLDDVAARYNEVLSRYGASSARNLTADELAARFWTDNDTGQSPYDRGRLLATIWDHRIREASDERASLDTVLLRQRELAARAGHGAAAALFPVAMDAVAPGVDTRGEIARHILHGETITLPADVFEGCLVVGKVTVPVFDLGFDAKTSRRIGEISGVDPTGAAYAAGLRDGMKRISGQVGRFGDSRFEVTYRIAGPDGVEREIRWRPEGHSKVSFQQVSVPAMAADRRPACTRLLAGD